MKKTFGFKIILAIIILSIFPIGYKIVKKRLYINAKKERQAAYSDLVSKTLQHDPLNKAGFAMKHAQFDKDGIDDIALIMMVKDEDDIIYENLVWHFCVGFRKFVIVDNNSNDKTRERIEKFKTQTLGKAVVIIVDDPIVEYIQSRITTGVMRFANSTWPEVTWIFPVDADEFWYPNLPLKDVLSNVPQDKDIILTLQYQHLPTETADKINENLPFYDSITYRHKTLSSGLGKVAVKANPNIIIDQGNHNAHIINHTTNLNYISGNIIGLDMRHFQRRSLAQVRKKYWNGAQANIAAQSKKLIDMGQGIHWTSFMEEVNQKGLEQTTKDRFNEFVASKNDCVKDPLPVEEALNLFKEIITKR